jgi:hypothetical protein
MHENGRYVKLSRGGPAVPSPAVSHPATHHHVKHGIAAILLGLACLAFAWFRSGPRGRPAASRP